jgi:hypothetical protein
LEVKLSLDSNTDWKARMGMSGEPSDVRVRSLLASVQIGQYVVGTVRTR